jgi:hypothetical protein
VNAERRSLNNCYGRVNAQVYKQLQELQDNTDFIGDLSIVKDAQKTIAVTTAGALWEIAKVGGRITLKRTVLGGLQGAALLTALEAIYGQGKYVHDMHEIISSYDTDYDNCHKTVEEMYGISFRAPFGTQAFPRPIPQGPMW